MSTEKVEKTFRDELRASVEAQLGRQMSPETQALVDTICESVDEGTDLVGLHQTLAELHRAMVAVQSGDIDEDQVLAALRMTMAAMERGENSVEALERHLSPLLPQQEVCY